MKKIYKNLILNHKFDGGKIFLNGGNKFYLYFELKDIKHAEELFEEMLETFETLKNHEKIKILLCCTSGLTTNFFKEKLNEAAEILSLDYEFYAVSFSKIYSEAFPTQKWRNIFCSDK